MYGGTLLACAEMIRSGTTTLADGYFCLEGSARAIRQSGMRAVLAPGVIDFPAPGVPDPADNIRVARDFIEKWEGLCPRIRLGVFPHSPYTCSRNTLEKAQGPGLGKKNSFLHSPGGNQGGGCFHRAKPGSPQSVICIACVVWILPSLGSM